MRRSFVLQPILTFFLCLQAAYGQQNTPQQVFNKNYKAPLFIDSNRDTKIAAAFPVLERLCKDYALAHHFPGLAFGLIVDGKLVYTVNYGYTDLPNHTLVQAGALFRIASMTKSFTAMAILKLRDEGKLSLEDPAYKYIPQLRQMPSLTSDASPITIRQLMTHSAGFPEDNPWGDRQLADTDEELMQLVGKGISFSNVPGIGYEYSNLGFALLGKIITVVSGKPYQQYITENILAPLGMTHTVWEYTLAPKDRLAHGYRWLNGQWIEEPLLHDGSYGAMGGLITSIEDFSTYIALHLSAWPPGNDRDNGPVRRSTIREMHQPGTFSSLNTTFSYPGGRTCPMVNFYNDGIRWSRDCQGRLFIGHTGGLPGFGSQWQSMPDYGIGIVTFANLTYAGVGALNWAVLDTLIAIAGLHPRQLPVPDILAQRKQELLRLLPDWSNATHSDIFAVNFFKDYIPDSLRKTCQDIFAAAGKIRKIGELIPENQLRGGFVIEGEKRNIHIYFTLTPENPALIQQFNISSSTP